MKRRIDEIPVSDRLDLAVAKGMQQVHFIHRKQIIKRSIAMAASFAILIGGFFIWGFSNPVLASQIPFIGRIFEQNEDKISFPGDYSEKAEILDNENKVEISSSETEPSNSPSTTETISNENIPVYSVSKAGYTFSANEVYADGSSIYLGMTVNKDIGFGKVYEYYSDRDGSTLVQGISIFCAVIDIYANEPFQLIVYNTNIEGTQISDNTFEGILKIDLQDYVLPEGEFTMDIDIQSIYCMDTSKTDQSDTNYSPNANWKLTSVPFTVKNSDVKVFEINESNANNFGIENIIVTPTEVKVQSILPPLYASQEELLAAKREFAGEEGIGMSDAEIDEYVSLALFGNYGLSVFDANGNALEFQKRMESNTKKGYLNTFSVKDADTSILYIYISEGDHETIKETDQNSMKDRAVYSYVLDTNF